MDFNAQQMREDALIKEGRYKFTVLDAREKRSGSGNDMINLKLALEVNGRKVNQFDSLIMLPKMFWKFEHFCTATKMTDKLDAGRLMAQDCFGKEGYVDIVQKANGQTGEIENQVKDYIKPEDHEAREVFNDDVPNFK